MNWILPSIKYKKVCRRLIGKMTHRHRHLKRIEFAWVQLIHYSICLEQKKKSFHQIFIHMVCSNSPLTEQHTSFMFLTFYWQDHDCSCCKFTFSHDFFNQWSFMSFLYLANDKKQLFKKKIEPSDNPNKATDLLLYLGRF